PPSAARSTGLSGATAASRGSARAEFPPNRDRESALPSRRRRQGRPSDQARLGTDDCTHETARWTRGRGGGKRIVSVAPPPYPSSRNFTAKVSIHALFGTSSASHGREPVRSGAERAHLSRQRKAECDRRTVRREGRRPLSLARGGRPREPARREVG